MRRTTKDNIIRYRNFNNSYTNSKSEILNVHPVRYMPNLFFETFIGL